MAGIRMACPGCDTLLEISSDSHLPASWQVSWQVTAHQHRLVRLDQGKMFIDCSKGLVFAVPLPKRESESDLDVEDQLWESARQQFIDGKHPDDIAGEMNLPRSVMRRWIYTDGLNDRPSLREHGDLTPEVLERAMRKVGMLSEKAADAVEHETWLEYHDRLVREYYDVEAEWALIKEICPELDRPELAPNPIRRRSVRVRAPWSGLATAWVLIGLVNLFVLDNLTLAIVWFSLAMGVLSLGLVRR